jgi:ferredoxin-NADP reductase
MAVPQKLRCRVEAIVDHGERVYTLALRPDRPAPRFRAGQFLHLALDPYDPSRFWPESRVFSIASAPTRRDLLKITYAVHGRFTTRMERELVEGGDVWIKLPYGDFVIETHADVVMLAGGTGITAFTAFLEGLEPAATHRVVVAYGARDARLLIYRDLVERCAKRVPSVEVCYFIENGSPTPLNTGLGSSSVYGGRVSIAALWRRVNDLPDATYYVAGPPAMLETISDELRAHCVAPEAIRIDAWE